MIHPHAANSGATPPLEFLFYASVRRSDRRICFKIRRFAAEMCVPDGVAESAGEDCVAELLLPFPKL